MYLCTLCAIEVRRLLLHIKKKRNGKKYWNKTEFMCHCQIQLYVYKYKIIDKKFFQWYTYKNDVIVNKLHH